MNGALSERVVQVDVSSPKYPEATMLVDEAFAQRFCGLVKWCVDNTGYAVASIDGKKTEFHRLIMQNYKTGLDVDHINGDKLDNRIANLRYVPRATNAQNKASKPGSSSEYIGVHLRASGRWYATIRVDGRNRHLGSFATQEDAAAALERRSP